MTKREIFYLAAIWGKDPRTIKKWDKNNPYMTESKKLLEHFKKIKK